MVRGYVGGGEEELGMMAAEGQVKRRGRRGETGQWKLTLNDLEQLFHHLFRLSYPSVLHHFLRKPAAPFHPDRILAQYAKDSLDESLQLIERNLPLLLYLLYDVGGCIGWRREQGCLEGGGNGETAPEEKSRKVFFRVDPLDCQDWLNRRWLRRDVSLLWRPVDERGSGRNACGR